MPKYYFDLHDDETIKDDRGTDLIDVAAARVHAAGVAHELTFKRAGMLQQSWSQWTMRVHDHEGIELFSIALSDAAKGNC
jgi:uncharacterized protein DUF6894